MNSLPALVEGHYPEKPGSAHTSCEFRKPGNAQNKRYSGKLTPELKCATVTKMSIHYGNHEMTILLIEITVVYNINVHLLAC